MGRRPGFAMSCPVTARGLVEPIPVRGDKLSHWHSLRRQVFPVDRDDLTAGTATLTREGHDAELHAGLDLSRRTRGIRDDRDRLGHGDLALPLAIIDGEHAAAIAADGSR